MIDPQSSPAALMPVPVNALAPACRLCRAGFPVREDGFHYGTQRLGMIPDTCCMEEYLRRNLNVARAVGAMSLVDSILKRLGTMKRPPLWLVEKVGGIGTRIHGLPKELAAYRNEVKP